MVFLFRKRDKMTDLVLKAQAGNEEARETLIRKYTPFVLKVASVYCSRYLTVGEDDEISISLMAFNEAIDKYTLDKGTKFLTFAEVVIKRRLTDFYRKESRFSDNTVPLSTLKDDGNEEKQVSFDIVEANKIYQTYQEKEDRKEEIIQFNEMLSKFNITLAELVKISPKHIDARYRAYDIAKLIVENKDFLEYVWKKKSLPLKELEKRVNVSRKTLERQRKYIIALVLILQSNLDYLKTYIKDMERGESYEKI